MYFDEEMVEFFEAGSVDSLAAAIRRLYEDKARRDRLVTQSAARFGNEFRWNRHKLVYTGLVESVLARG